MLKHFKYIMSAIFAFISDEYAQDSRWVYVGTSDSANYYYDSKTIKSDGDEGEIRIKFVYVDSEEWDYCLGLYRVFCDERMLMAEASLYYDKTGKETEVLSREKVSFLPDTPEEAIFNVFVEKTGS